MNRMLPQRGLFFLAGLAAVSVGVVAVADHHEGDEGAKWFDPAGCTMCQPMAEKPELMMGTKWETHKLDNGVVMTAVAPEGKVKEYHAVTDKMHSKAPEPGDKLCGFCQAFGGLIQAGAKVQEVPTDFGAITIITSDDQATVAKIHKMADRTIEETKKWEAQMQGAF